MSRGRAAGLTVVAAAAMALAACGDDGGGGGETPPSAPTVDPSDVEAELRAETVSEVDCPGSVPSGEGARFKCEVTAANGTGKLTVTQVDPDGTRFRYRGTVGSKGVPTQLEGTISVR